MPKEQSPDRTPACRWRTSAETLDVIEALERIEALLLRLDERLHRVLDVDGTTEAKTTNRP
jgi:hypothetical protein